MDGTTAGTPTPGRSGAGVEPIDTVTGRFYTLRVERWGGPRRLEAYWYNPRIRYWVRLEDYLRGYQEELVEVPVVVGVVRGRAAAGGEPGPSASWPASC